MKSDIARPNPIKTITKAFVVILRKIRNYKNSYKSIC